MPTSTREGRGVKMDLLNGSGLSVINILSLLCFLVSIVNYKKSGGKPSFFLLMAAILYMVAIRLFVLLVPDFNSVEMVIGFWLIFLASLWFKYREWEEEKKGEKDDGA
jgi:hypothetical protein